MDDLDPPQPLQCLQALLDHLAQLVLAPNQRPYPDRLFVIKLNRTIDEFKKHVPGLYQAPDESAATVEACASQAAIWQRQCHLGLSRALWGLTFSPHRPELWRLVGLACLHMDRPEPGVRALQHALWINPAYTPAREDLELLAAHPQSFCVWDQMVFDAEPSGQRPNTWPYQDDEPED